jgi:hypothetical protein
MKKSTRFARIHYTIKTDCVITRNFILSLINDNSDSDSNSQNYAKIEKIENDPENHLIEVFSTEKIYRIVHNKNLKANITVHEQN